MKLKTLTLTQVAILSRALERYECTNQNQVDDKNFLLRQLRNDKSRPEISLLCGCGLLSDHSTMWNQSACIPFLRENTKCF